MSGLFVPELRVAPPCRNHGHFGLVVLQPVLDELGDSDFATYGEFNSNPAGVSMIATFTGLGSLSNAGS